MAEKGREARIFSLFLSNKERRRRLFFLSAFARCRRLVRGVFYYMKMKFVSLFFTMIMISLTAKAALNLNVIPYEGGNSLRFGRVTVSDVVNKEVKIRITSTAGKQYQVFQRIVDPLVNEKGIQLNERALTSCALRGSNTAGALYQEQATELSFADQLLYTSSSAGEGDSFRMVYTLRGSRLNASGNFTGKIIYTLRPIGEGTQQTYILNVFIEASGEFRIETNGSWDKNSVRLSTASDNDKKGFIEFSFKGNMNRKLNVYQEIFQFPENSLKEEICQDSINFFTSGGKRGELYHKSPTALKRKRALVYSSSSDEDIFFVNFILDDEAIETQSAGRYRGVVTYLVEGFGIQQTISVNLEIEIMPVFKLEVELSEGGLRFSDLAPESDPQIREVQVKVKSNLGKPYIVTHNMRSSLVSQEGRKLASDLFTMKTEFTGKESGEIRFIDFTPVPLDEVSLFFSDEKGSPAQFKTIYKVETDLSVKPGDYSTTINYSLGER